MGVPNMKNTTRLTPTIALLALLLVPGLAGAQSLARTWAMGGAGVACSRGMAAVESNPANLAFSRGFTLNLAGAAVDLHNNSFSLSRYNEFSGATLDDADKERLLADIPAAGFALDADVHATAPGLQIGHFALSSRAFAAGRGNLDKDFFDLVLFGNEVGETVDFDDTWGEGHAVGAATLSFGQPVISGSLGRLAVGFNASYLRGLYEVHVEQAGGQITTAFDEISGEAAATAVTSDGGSGYALDLGASLQTLGGWTFGVAMDNVTSHLTWDGTPERHEFTVTATGISANQDNFDNAVVDTDTTYAVSSYTTTLPPRLRAGAAHDSGRFLLAADVVQGMRDGAGASTTPRASFGLEWRPFGWFTPRAGFSLGGEAGSSISGGLGLNLLVLHLDLAVMSRGGLNPNDTRGLGFAVGAQLAI
jgi:hypothetical protein